MPIVDMPLEKLKTYRGINPRPADFDEFWDRALKEMNEIDPHPVFTPTACFAVTFSSIPQCLPA